MARTSRRHRHGLAAPDGVPLPQRYWAILTIALGLTLAVLDGAIANVALPTIARDLDASPASSIWVVNAYQLAVTISLLPLASLGDIYGYRRVYQYGPDRLHRLLAGLRPVGFAADADHRARHPGLRRGRHHERQRRAGALHLSAPLARPRRRAQRDDRLDRIRGRPDSRGRHPVGRTMALAVRGERADRRAGDPDRVPRTAAHARSGVRFDAPSAIWSALTFGVLVSAISGLGHGESASLAGAELCFAMVFGFVLVTRQLSQHSPMLPVDLLRIPLFALSVATSICSFIATEHGAGLAAVPVREHPRPQPGGDRSAADAVAARRGGDRAVHRPIVRPLSGGAARRCGLAVMATGLALLSLLPAHPTAFDIVWRMLICGIGFGFFNTPNNRAILTSAPPLRAGAASGMQATSRLLGQSMGAALVALMFGLFPESGTREALVVAACTTAASAVVSFVRLTAA